jgi:aspartyl-tRNA(Asn)/glutamyl-tRNA(Gln) amidotransferase subunit C
LVAAAADHLPTVADRSWVSYVLGGAVHLLEKSMSLTLSEVEHIAELARLALTDDEKALYREQLSAILDYAAILQKVDTSAIPPTATVLPLRNVMRDDAVQPSMPVEDVLANAPAAEDRCFQVTAILDATSS